MKRPTAQDVIKDLLLLVEAVKPSAGGGVYCERINGVDWITAARAAIAKYTGNCINKGQNNV